MLRSRISRTTLSLLLASFLVGLFAQGSSSGHPRALWDQRRRRVPQRPAAGGERPRHRLAAVCLPGSEGAAAAFRRPAAALRKPPLRRPGVDRGPGSRLLQGRHLRGPRRPGRIDDRTAARGDDRARFRLRGAPHLRRHPRRHDVRGRLRGRPGPPLPDGRAAAYRPRRTLLLPRRLQRLHRRLAVGLRAVHGSGPRKAARRRCRQNTAKPASRRSTTSRATSKGSMPTSPPPTPARKR